MLKLYFKIALRNLARYRANTFINILGITLGVTGSIIIYTIVKDEISFDSFHSRAQDTYRVVQHNHTADGTQYWNTTAYPLAEALKDEFPEFSICQTAGPSSMKVSSESNESAVFEEERILFVDEDFLNVFDFKKAFPDEELWIAGNAQSAFEDVNAVVLTQKVAHRYFGDIIGKEDDLLGKTLFFNDTNPLTVTGVIQDPPRNTSLLFEMLIPYEFFKIHNDYQVKNWSGNHQGTTFMVLPSYQDSDEIAQKINTLKAKFLSREDNNRIEYVLQPLKEVHTETLYGSSPGSYVISKGIINGFIVLAFFLLVIGCINFINLATAQSLRRSKEVGVRKVLGSSKSQLFFQFMSEAFLIVVVAFVISIFISKWAIQEINAWIPMVQFQYVLELDFAILGITIIGSITFLAGSYPALVLSRFSPVNALKNSIGTNKEKGFSSRQLLIVFQFCIAQLLIVGTVIVASQMEYFRSKDLGYNKENIITLNIPENNPEKMDAFRQKLVQYPQVEQVGFSSGPPTAFERQFGTTFRLSHEPLEMRREAEMKLAGPEYLQIYKLKLLAGNWIQETNNKEGFNGFVVNESLMNMLGLSPEESLGEVIKINEGEAPIIGVVKDFHNNSLQEDISPCLFFYWEVGLIDEASVLLAGNINEEQLFEAINLVEKSWAEVYPNEILTAELLDDRLGRNYILEGIIYKASQIAAVIAILIACLGLYGLISLAAVQRTKELGIRKVLGASIRNIFQLLSWDFVKLVIVAILIATPFAWYFMDQWLQEFAHRINLGWWYFAGAGTLTIIIALVTLSFQSIKAAMVDPVKSLRNE